jgi:ketosteroid isomerase-like protein
MGDVPRDLMPGDGQDVLARFKAAREQRDVDAMLSIFAEDVEARPDPFEATLLGHVAVRDYWNRVAAEQRDVEFDAERVWVSGRTVLASWHAAWTRIADGDRLRERGFTVLEIDDAGTATRWRCWSATRVVAHDASVVASSSSSGRMEEEDGR